MLRKADLLTAPSFWKNNGIATSVIRRGLFFLVTTALLFTTACSSQKTQPPATATPSTQSQSAAQLQRWEANGKIGVRSPRENGSANLIWMQAGDNYRIHLSGPLGAGATVISGSSSVVSLQRGSDPAVFAANPAQLTEQVMGWPLPVSEMFYWVRGIPAPGAVAGQQKNSRGQLQSLQQSGWQLTFADYTRAGPYTLPTRIKAATNQAAGPVTVTVVIKEWQPR